MTNTNDDIELNEKAQARMADLRFIGELTQVDANARGFSLLASEHGAQNAADHIHVSILLDEHKIIRDIRYRSLATGLDLLTFDLMAEWCLDRPLDSAAACSPNLLSGFLDAQGYGFRASTAGSNGEDQPYYVLVKIAGREQAKSGDSAPKKKKKAKGTAQELPWDDVGLFEKVRRVEEVLDEQVREALASDGGGIELIDLREANDVCELVVQYSGACGSCSSSVGGTMQFIEDTLESALGRRFRLDVQGDLGEEEDALNPLLS